MDEQIKTPPKKHLAIRIKVCVLLVRICTLSLTIPNIHK